MRKALFIDKDGTLIKDVPYNANPDLVILSDHAGEALSLIKDRDYLIIVISNQSGVAQGLFEEIDLAQINAEIQKQLSIYKVQVDAFYYCPHLEDGIVEKYSIKCNCRKPKPGLILQAARDLVIDVKSSWMLGDILNDAEAGNAAGCKTLLLDNGNETEWVLNKKRIPDFTVQNLQQAAQIIIKEEKIKEEIL